MEKQSKTQKLVTSGLLMSLEVILTRLLSIQTPFVRIGFGFLPVSIMGILYGPIWSGIVYALGDFIGMMIFNTSSAAYFPGFTLTAFLVGTTYGIVLHKKEITYKRCFLAAAIVCLGLNLFMDTYWLYILMDTGVIAMLPGRILKCVLMVPIQGFLIHLVWHRVMSKIVK